MTDQRGDIKRALISDSEGSLEEHTLDVNRVIKKNKRSRQSKVDYNKFVHSHSTGRPQLTISSPTPQRKSSSPQRNRWIQEEEMDDYSTVPKAYNVRESNQDQISLLSNYENNAVIGMLLYLLFIVFLGVEVLVSSWCLLTINSEQDKFKSEDFIILLLCSEMLYYCLTRYFLSKYPKYRPYEQSLSRSIDKIMQARYNYERGIKQILSMPKLLMTLIVLMVFGFQLCYSYLMVYSLFPFGVQQQGCFFLYSILWVNTCLPCLMVSFYLNRPYNESSSKLQYFLLLVGIYSIFMLFESLVLVGLFVTRLGYTYICFKKGFETIHIEQGCKGLLLVLMVAIKIYATITVGSSTSFVGYMGSLMSNGVVICAAMFVTRILTLKYLRKELYNYFYTEMYINIALVMAVILLALSYVSFQDITRTKDPFSLIFQVVVFSLVVLVVYYEGSDRLTVDLNLQQEQQKI